jgi:hypothetical protein
MESNQTSEYEIEIMKAQSYGVAGRCLLCFEKVPLHLSYPHTKLCLVRVSAFVYKLILV